MHVIIASNMTASQPASVKLENNCVSLTIDPFGGAVTAFCLKGNDINPLSFAFSNERMPVNNTAGANYQGHFVCIGRGGEPTQGEIKAGLPNHGEPANILWTVTENRKAGLQMQTVAAKEGLQVDRTIIMDEHSALYAVKEIVININALGRLYNIVQHPTLAAPFLDETTIINCNASTGFNQALYKDISSNVIEWPLAKDDLNNIIDLRNPRSSYNAVYSFVVKPVDKYGWITAFSPTHKLLCGYIWKRSDYPWIHLWQHYNQGKIQYRGIEFGTAGIHQPFPEILNTATTLFGEKTYEYIDAGQTITKSYFSFIQSIEDGFTGVEDVSVINGAVIIKAMTEGYDISIKLTQQLADELSK